MSRVPLDPRLPTVGAADYDRQLNARLYDLLRHVLVALNAATEGRLPVVTTTEKNALAAAPGMVVFDTTLGKACVYTGSAWQTISSS